MTTDEIDALTIKQVRQIAERAAEALAQLQSVQALLGGAAGASMATPSPQRAAAPPSMPPSMAAQREQLLARNREALPEDIKRAEGIS